MSERREVLLDSNIIIYATTDPGGPAARYAASVDPVASAITRVEVLGFHKIDVIRREILERYFETVTVAPIDDAVVARAIALRQTRKMSLGDSIIAATALEHGLPLATRNVVDFQWIAGLELIDPFVPPDGG